MPILESSAYARRSHCFLQRYPLWDIDIWQLLKLNLYVLSRERDISIWHSCAKASFLLPIRRRWDDHPQSYLGVWLTMALIFLPQKDLGLSVDAEDNSPGEFVKRCDISLARLLANMMQGFMRSCQHGARMIFQWIQFRQHRSAWWIILQTRVAGNATRAFASLWCWHVW